MLDVHPAHHAASTWRDFFIHVATICLGLLIAIGLEQTVEYVHHRHQRSQLEEDLRHEAQVNRNSVAISEAIFDREMEWLLKLRRQVNVLRAGGPKGSFIYPEPPEAYPNHPTRLGYRILASTVWNTARDSHLVELLPVERARDYGFMYEEQALTNESYFNVFAPKWKELTDFEFQFDDGTLPGKPNVARMNAAQLDEYARLLGEVYLSCRAEKRRVKIFEALNEAVLSSISAPLETADDYLRTHPDALDLGKDGEGPTTSKPGR